MDMCDSSLMINRTWKIKTWKASRFARVLWAGHQR